MRLALVALFAGGMIAALGTIVAGAAAAPPTTAPTTDEGATPLDPRVDRVLTLMQERKVESLHASIRWQLRYEVDEPDEADVKQGALWYRQMEPTAKFKVSFDKKIVMGRSWPMDEEHLFDGRWYVEKNARANTVIRREIRRPDEKVDPYKLGEGPFPLPFGQAKQDIVDEFVVTWVERVADDPNETAHLRLVPREDTQTAQRYGEIHFWVRTEGPLSGLPMQVKASKKSGAGRIDSHLTLTFSDVALNEKIDADVFEIRTPPGWQEQVEPLEPVHDAPQPEAGQP